MGTRCGAGIAALVIIAAFSMSEQGLAQTQPARSAVADAQSANQPTISIGPTFQNWLTQPTMTGDWGGLRTRLEHDGINLRASYVGNYAYNFSGGKRIA